MPHWTTRRRDAPGHDTAVEINNFPQLFGSWLVVWDDLLPEYLAALAATDAAVVADALVFSYGGQRGPKTG